MAYCSKCGAQLSNDQTPCLQCSKKTNKPRFRLGFLGSSFLLLIGAFGFIWGNEIHSYFTCGATRCAIAGATDFKEFLDQVGQGFTAVATVILIKGIGLCLMLWGVIGLIVAFVNMNQRNQQKYKPNK